MRPADPDRGVTCPYGKPGSAWATGEHGGIDYGCPSGDPVYAMWGGTVTGASWGSAYGTQIVIDHDHLPDGSPGLWAVYAHLSGKKVSSGERVNAGQLIGYSGATGNVSGAHLHVEVQRDSQWRSGNYTDPQPWIDAREDEPAVNVYDYDYLEKPGGTQDIGRSWEKLDQSGWTPKRSGIETTFSYFRITPRFKSGKTAGALQARLMRENGDAHAPTTIPIHIDMLEDDGSYPATFQTFELGEDGGSTHVELRCVGGLESASLGSARYTTKTVIADKA
jgi:hypothetical protein